MEYWATNVDWKALSPVAETRTAHEDVVEAGDAEAEEAEAYFPAPNSRYSS